MKSIIINTSKPKELPLDMPYTKTKGIGIFVSILMNCIIVTLWQTFSSPLITLLGTVKRTIYYTLSSNYI